MTELTPLPSRMARETEARLRAFIERASRLQPWGTKIDFTAAKWKVPADRVGHPKATVTLDFSYFKTIADLVKAYINGHLAKDARTKLRPTKAAKESAAINDLKRRLRARDDVIMSKDEEINRWRQMFVRLVINGEHQGVDVRRLWTSEIPTKAGRVPDGKRDLRRPSPSRP